MKENETLSHYRVISFLIILLCMIFLSSFLCFMQHVNLDLWICSYILDFLFFLSILLQMEFERKRAKISDNVETTFFRISMGFVVCSIMAGAMFFAPAYFRPVLLFPLVMYAVGNSVISISCSLYLSLLLCIYTSSGIYEFCTYILLILLGIVWIRAIDPKRRHLHISLILGLLSFLVPQIFVYYAERNLYTENLLYGAIIGLIIFFICYFFYRKVRYNTVIEIRNRLNDVLSEDYSEVIELKAYSSQEYRHARMVSDLCQKYAEELFLDEELCATAGFYYRIGKWKGEPHVQNGVLFAKKLCFPTEVIKIISEYYGEEQLPSTKESALVHIVDATLIKLQVLKEEAKASGWNTELLIYQTLNEFSQSGIYDDSGLSMNQFLKLRELLAKEERISEFLS